MVRLHFFVIILSIIAFYFIKNLLNELFPNNKFTLMFNSISSSTKGFIPIIFLAGILWVILYMLYGELPY